jgi:pimeloyl-ACP methyl ester carboxylesterase
VPKNDEERAAIAAYNSATQAYIDRYVAQVQRAAGPVRIVAIPGANHYIFLSDEAVVLQELQNFVRALRR